MLTFTERDVKKEVILNLISFTEILKGGETLEEIFIFIKIYPITVNTSGSSNISLPLLETIILATYYRKFVFIKQVQIESRFAKLNKVGLA